MEDDAGFARFQAPSARRVAMVFCFGVASISTGAIFVRFAAAPPLVTAAYRVGLATLLLLPMALPCMCRELRAASASVRRAVGLSGLFLAVHFASWITSLSYTSVANSVVLVNTTPIWVAVLSVLVLKERPSRTMLTGVGVSVAGGVVVGVCDTGVGDGAWVGDVLALIGGMAGAAYITLGRRARRSLSLPAYASSCYGVAAVCLWAVVLMLRLPVTGFPATTWRAFLGMALISQVVGHSSYNWALRYISAGAVSVGLLGEPIGSTLLAYLLLGETVSVGKVFGCVLILAGILLAARAESVETASPSLRTSA